MLLRLLPALALPFALAAVEVPVLEPANRAAAAARKPEPGRWAWNATPAEITAAGDLAWKPLPFVPAKASAPRYIDFAGGDDGNDGLSQAKPWKHHPWDPAAGGAAKACSGVHTYVFKRGVVYRGTLLANESGKPGDPIRLTSDPAWGTGEAILSGAEAVTGWKRGADKAEIPEAGEVWWADVPYPAKDLWELGKDGPQRIPLARTPNWTVSDSNDVMKEWWTLEQPEWWTGKWKIDFNGHRAHVGIDRKHLDQPASYYVGAIVRPEFAVVMGTPFPTRVEGFDEANKGLIFQGIWTGDSEQHWTGNRYYLEDMPQYLDSAGEFWSESRGAGARIYLRLPGDRDPNTAAVEAGARVCIVESTGLSEVEFTGLTFRGGNTHWDLAQPGWGHPDVANAAIRVLGPSQGLRVANCRFLGIPGRALRLDAKGGAFDRFAFDDNEVLSTDHGAIAVDCGGRGAVEVLRNRMHDIGGRPHRQDWGHALVVNCPETMEIAGNILDRCYGAGIFVFGGKGSGDDREVAFSRSLIHGNRVVDSLLAANDWGGIETWQCGPHYVYDNISGNAVGYWNCTRKPDQKGSACLGFAYYFDGSFRNAVFNNIAWGGTADRDSPFFAQAAYYEAVPTIENAFFNNTAVDFKVGTNWSPAGGRHLVLGNLWQNIAGPVLQWGKLKEDKDPPPPDYDHASTAVARNLLTNCGDGKVLGIFEASGAGYPDLPSLKAAMAARKLLAGDVGTASEQPVLAANGSARSFRPKAGAATPGAGVKVFVPWAIGRTVGEWNFRRNQADPAVILDDHWYPTAYLVEREHYWQAPTYPLHGEGIAAADYVAGPLEDWCDGALRLDGKAQRAVLAQADLAKPYEYQAKGQKRTAQAADLATPDIATSDLLIEAYVQPARGAGGAIVAKLGEAGYRLALSKAGGVTLTLVGGGQVAALASGAVVNDGKWHHILAEVDRAAGTMAIYTDGVRTAAGKLGLAADASLANPADLVVGQGFAGCLDYLRIARCTLAASRTSIEELYDWEFAGPFLRDFAGKAPVGGKRSAGALEP